MAKTDLLRTSRDGDQFHYHWAARRCLALLPPMAPLTAVAIEGASAEEFTGDDGIVAGEQVIDIAEYFGSEQLPDADRVVYRQLKHSTVRDGEAWTMSELKGTLSGFAERFTKLRETDASLLDKVSFRLVSNRPVGVKVSQTLEDLLAGSAPRHKSQMTLLRGYLGIEDDAVAAEFCRLVDLGSPELGLAALSLDFERRVGDYLPGVRGDAPLRLKEIVSRRATSLEDSNSIRRSDVLVALGASEDQLMPAPCRLTPVANRLDREQFRAIADQIVRAQGPVVVHAVGGIGKSVLAGSLGRHLPDGSECVTYDCFGAGGYRLVSELRHEHRQVVLQIANELAARGLCQPLVPSASATAADYMRVFLDRVASSATVLGARRPDALLVIAVDAADNAVTAAQEFGHRSFVPDLLREKLPANVRLVMFARTERVASLEAPSSTLRIELRGFDLGESGAHMRARFADAADADVAEFHHRTFGNPRVQATALADTSSAPACLRSLALAGVPDAAGVLDAVIARSVGKVRDERKMTTGEVDGICEALAALRPRVPVQVIAELCDVPSEAVHSFVSDLGRPLLIEGGCVQFRDEPTETWFRRNHRPAGRRLDGFLERLRPLADRHVYAAASLPQLLWEAGRLADLVDLAVDGAALPALSPLERAEIEQQRVQFALKAAMKQKARAAAVRLALKAGSLSLGHTRRRELVKANTCLAGDLLDAQSLDELVARGPLGEDWPGSNLAYEGCLLSSAGQRDLARSRLRSAIEWIDGWSRLPESLSRQHRLDGSDLAQVALGLVNTDGIEAAVAYLGGWQPAEVVYRAGRIVTAGLIETGRVEQIADLIVAAEPSMPIQLAALSQAGKFDLPLDASAARAALAMFEGHSGRIGVADGADAFGSDFDALWAAIAFVTAAASLGVAEPPKLGKILSLYLPSVPPRGIGATHGTSPDVLLKAYALKAHLEGRELTDRDLAHPDLVKKLDKQNYSNSRDLEEFKRNITPSLPWASLWARVASSPDDVEEEFEQLAASTYSRSVSDYQTPRLMLASVARLSAQILSRRHYPTLIMKYGAWLETVWGYMFWPTLIDVVRHSALSRHMDDVIFAVAGRLDEQVTGAHVAASEKIDTFAALAKAIRPAMCAEAKAYFGRAVDTADKIGDDIMDRWAAINALARRAGDLGEDLERAYQVARTFEALSPYLEDAADHAQCIQTVSCFSRRSAVAIAARWRSRHFGQADLVLRQLLEPGHGLAEQAPLAGLALLPLAETSDVRAALQTALESGSADPQLLFDTAGDYDRIDWHSVEYFEHLDELAGRHAVDLSGTGFARDARKDRPVDNYTATHRHSMSWGVSDSTWKTRRAPDLAELAAIDVTCAAGLEQARRLCLDRHRNLNIDDLIDAVLATASRNLHEAITTFALNPHLGAYAHGKLLEKLEHTAGLPRAARDAARELATTAVSRFCDEILTRRYQSLSIEVLNRVTGQPAQGLYDTALAELGARNGLLDSAACFALVNNTAKWLPPADAREAFDQAADELDYLIDPATADGPWRPELTPPEDLRVCAAGYVWSALADPDDRTRWLAAHVVRLLGRLGAEAELGALAELADAASPQPFADSRMAFYDQHAQLWLLMALERLAVDNPASLRPFEAQLRRMALGTHTHVLMRESACRVLDALDRHGLIDLDSDERARLAARNKPISKIPATRTRRKPLGSRSRGRQEGAYRFHFDFEEHWIEPLARCFAMDPAEAVRMVSDVITTLWGLDVREGRVEDLRQSRGLFDRQKTFYHKYDTPIVHDLDFYLSFHALMTVAGQLIDTRPARDDPDSFDSFPDWLQRFRPTRPDGRWLADRRDPVPADRSTLSDAAYRDGAWTQPVTSEDLTAQIFEAEPGMITVWEWSEQNYHDSTEIVTVESALVEPNRSSHLLAAWQVSASSYDFRVPTAGDDCEIDVAGYRLLGWIKETDLVGGLDERDPLAGGVKYPGPRPSGEACAWLDLGSDADQRLWHQDGRAMMRSYVWRDLVDRDASHTTGSQGQRLSATIESLRLLTDATNMNVIFKVTIERRRPATTGDKAESDDPASRYTEPDFKVVVFDGRSGFVEL
ncbi:hypothetical protein [Micromonospora sp. SL4-19]|uniref:hypothetical protein n=1 Tax=Micromonospora sp. SL4-19 TaxID=3399129 RepID=UPI003A4DDA56